MKMQCSLLFILLIKVQLQVGWSQVQCGAVQCEKFCDYSTPDKCCDGILNCHIKPNSNFDILVTLIFVIVAFAIGK
jgi:hypothetical protein